MTDLSKPPQHPIKPPETLTIDQLNSMNTDLYRSIELLAQATLHALKEIKLVSDQQQTLINTLYAKVNALETNLKDMK